MLLFSGFLGVVALAVWIFCIVDVITTPPARLRVLPKWLWVVLVIVLVDLGSILWLVLGHRWSTPQRVSVAARPSNPDDDEEFLATLRARAAEQRKRATDTDQQDGDDKPKA